MLTKLIINNLVLVERAEVPFLPGLNILTGETGSGKSALIDALHLVTGGRADFGLIRHGA
ncbi:MAG: AAA family ATPase, partial [Chlamydiia bacterium]|nr:AAA family ATPase [Chlamydiia bacterium]